MISKNVCGYCRNFDMGCFYCTHGEMFELKSDDNMVYTIKLDSFNTEVKDIERTVESLEKFKKDNINSPSHYADRRFETIDVIEDCIKANKLDGYQGYLYGNVIKYISRIDCKGDALDNAKKAQWYLNRLIEVRENEKVHD